MLHSAINDAKHSLYLPRHYHSMSQFKESSENCFWLVIFMVPDTDVATIVPDADQFLLVVDASRILFQANSFVDSWLALGIEHTFHNIVAYIAL